MAVGFSVLDALNKNSKAGIDELPKASFRTKDISIYKMYRNSKNFYKIVDIEELANKILLVGLMENLAVVYAPSEQGEYRIIAGERRWEALKLLVSKGYKEFETVTCQIRTLVDEAEEQIELIVCNAYRTKCIADIMQEEQALKENLEKLKQQRKKIKGYDLSQGRLRDVIADMLNMSKTKVAQIENVNKNLIQEFKAEVKAERVNFSTANEIAGLSEENQKKAYEQYKESGSITAKDVREMKQSEESIVSESDTQIPGQSTIEDYFETHENETSEREESHYCEAFGHECNLEERRFLAQDAGLKCKSKCCCSCEEKNECGCRCLVASKKSHISNNEEFEPQPDKVVSICYDCVNWNECDGKGNTVKKCNEFISKKEAYKTDEQRYNEQQDKIDKQTEKILQEREDERKIDEKLNNEQRERQVHYLRESTTKWDDYISGDLTFIPIRYSKKEDYRKGDKIELQEYAGGIDCGRRIIAEVTYVMNSQIAFNENYFVAGIKVISANR